MADIVAAYSLQLRLLSYALYAFSVVFGGKALGRFPTLTRPGGFYARVLVAIPATVFLTATSFLYLTIAPQTLVSGIISALGYPLTLTQLALLQGIFMGLLPVLLADSAYRPFFGARNPWSYAPSWVRGMVWGSRLADSSGNQTSAGNASASQNPPRAGQSTQGCLRQLVNIARGVIANYPVAFFTALLISQYLFVILGWFGGHRPPLSTLAVAAAIWAVYLPVALIAFVVGNAIIERTKSLITVLVIMILYVGLLLPVCAYITCLIAFTVYVALAVGWLFVLYLVGTQLAEYLLMAIRGGADRLGTRTLVTLFALPGVAATIIQFALANNNLLPR